MIQHDQYILFIHNTLVAIQLIPHFNTELIIECCNLEPCHRYFEIELYNDIILRLRTVDKITQKLWRQRNDVSQNMALVSSNSQFLISKYGKERLLSEVKDSIVIAHCILCKY